MSVIETMHTNPDFAVRMMRKKSLQDSAKNVQNQLKLLRELRDDQLKSQGSANALERKIYQFSIMEVNEENTPRQKID